MVFVGVKSLVGNYVTKALETSHQVVGCLCLNFVSHTSALALVLAS